MVVEIYSAPNTKAGDLTNYENLTVFEEINGQYILSFDTFTSELHKLKNEIYVSQIWPYVRVGGQMFVLSRYEKIRDDKTSLRMEYEHINYVGSGVPIGLYLPEELKGTPREIMEKILAVVPAGYIVGTVDFNDVVTYRPTAETQKGCFIEFAEGIGAELSFDNYKVSLVERRGSNKGLTLEVGVNIKSLSASFEKERSGDYWSYEVEFIDLSHVPGYDEIVSAELGDTVRVIDTELNIDTEERIVSIKYDPLNKALPIVQIGRIRKNLFNYDNDRDNEEPENFQIAINFELETDFEILGITGADDEDGSGVLKNNNVWTEWATVPFAPLVTINFSKKYRQKPSVNVHLFGGSSNPVVNVLTEQVNGLTLYTGITVSSTGSAEEITMHAIGRV